MSQRNQETCPVETLTDLGAEVFFRAEILWPLRPDDPYPAPDADARWLEERLLDRASGFGKYRLTPEAWREDRPLLKGPVVVYACAIDLHRYHEIAVLLEEARTRLRREVTLGELKLVDKVRLPHLPIAPATRTATDIPWR
jgi:hypothetical protein